MPEFTVRLEGEAGSSYAFDPATLELEAGKTYTIELVSTATFHTWTVIGEDGSYIENISVNGGETKTIETVSLGHDEVTFGLVPRERVLAVYS